MSKKRCVGSAKALRPLLRKTLAKTLQIPSSRRVKEIAKIAEQAVQIHSPRDVVVDPFQVADALELPVLPGEYQGAFDGLLEWRNGRFYMYYDTRLGGPDQPRVRFTIAHEIGHWYLDEHRECFEAGVDPHKSFTGFTSRNPVEREADTFASYLLVPPHRLREFAFRREPDVKLILGIAERFNVSRTAAAVRYVQANYCGCAVIRMGRDGSRVWSWTSDTLADWVYRTVRDDLPEGVEFARRFERACAGSDPVEGRLVPAETWYRYAGEKLDLYEELIPIGRYGVLVFLSTTE
ncbi:MAG TPA: hypothetical protein DEA08_18690 [Planctomycetes bacterium]|nr:hypothetical protein [Planctomycetota bacterium]|tara:strand:+ start:1330 stop:2208 length:879 start_codon:yes stop_codon:yes gene_type:complete